MNCNGWFVCCFIFWGMLEGGGMYDGLEGLPGARCSCISCYSPPADTLQYFEREKHDVVGHILRIHIRNGGIDTTFRNEVMAGLFRSFITLYHGVDEMVVTVGAGLAAAQAKGFRVRDPRVSAATSLGVQESEPFRVCPKWLDAADCVLDIPTFATSQSVCSIIRSGIGCPSIKLDADACLRASMNSGRVHACFGYQMYCTVDPDALAWRMFNRTRTTFFDQMLLIYANHDCRAFGAPSPTALNRKTFVYNLRAGHIPETLVVHYPDHGDEYVETISVGDDGEPHVLVRQHVFVDETGFSGTVCVFDLRGIFAEPPKTMVLHDVQASVLCLLLMCGKVDQEL